MQVTRSPYESSARAAGHLDDDEVVEVVAFGYSHWSPLFFPLTWLLVLIAREYLVLATDRAIKVMRASGEGFGVGRLIESQAVEEAQVTGTRFGIKVGTAPKIYGERRDLEPMREIARRAGGGPAPPWTPPGNE